MEQKQKQFIFNFLYVALIIGVLIFMFWMVGWLKTESAMCLKDPLRYYSEKIGEQCQVFCQGNFKGGG